MTEIVYSSPSLTFDLPVPPWWVTLWHVVRRGTTGRLLLLLAPSVSVPGQFEDAGWTVVAFPSSGGAPSADSLVAFDADLHFGARLLRDGGSFLVAAQWGSMHPQEWRREVEEAFHGTAHLLDPEPHCRWLIAFGWKGVRREVRQRVLMVTHVNALRLFGGGEVQVLESLLALREYGVSADVSLSLRLPLEGYEVVHVFSLYHEEKMHRLRQLRPPMVISPIWNEYSRLVRDGLITRAIFMDSDESRIRQWLIALKRGDVGLRDSWSEPVYGFDVQRQRQRELLRNAKLVIVLNRYEHSLLEKDFGESAWPVRLVPNGVSPDRLLVAQPQDFIQRYGLRDFVICAGRVEPAKNQAMLVWALRETGLPLVIVGDEIDQDYSRACRRWGGKAVHFLGRLAPELLASAFAAARVHALPSWGEVSELVSLEAGLAGCGLVVSERSGVREYLDPYAFTCDPADWVSIREAVLRAWSDTDPARTVALRKHILERYTWSKVAQSLAEAYNEAVSNGTHRGRGGQVRQKQAVPVRRQAQAVVRPMGSVLRVRWEGSQFVHHSLALVNREICLQLIEKGQELSIIPYEPDQFSASLDLRFRALSNRIHALLSRSVDAHVRHQWPPNFTPPPEGHWVMIQPWEFGSLPRRWVDVMSTQVDEVWVPSSYVRQCYVHSGVPSDRVHVIPNGVDPDRFRPDAPPADLARFGASEKRFKFLFVGGTIWRKGIDVLLKAYAKAFTSADDVCLVIKDMGGRSFYRGQTFEQEIRRFQAQPGAPAILYLDQDLLPNELPGLYRACDCLVHPYRGEGFGLPIAEAMACGLPVIVTNYGAALDFCNEDTAYLIPACERRLPERRIGNWETVDYPWVAEPDVEELTRLMRYVYEHQEEARAKGLRASEHIRTNFTWEKSAQKVIERIQALRERPIRRFEDARTVATPDGASFDGKKMLLLAETRSVHFLLMPDWSDPKDAWLTALEQFVLEFGPTEDVAVLVRIDPEEVPDTDSVASRLREWAQTKGFDTDDGQLVLLVNDRLGPDERHLVYDAAHVFIPTSTGEKGSMHTAEARERGLLVSEAKGAAMREAWKAVLERRGGETKTGTGATGR